MLCLSVLLLGAIDPTPPPGATGEVDRQSNGTLCFVVADEAGEESQLCRSEMGEYPKAISRQPRNQGVLAPVPPRPDDAPRDREVAVVEKDEPVVEAPQAPGSRIGIVSIAGAMISGGLESTQAPLSDPTTGPRVIGVAGIAGVGVRVGLLNRRADRRMLMPAVAFVGGAAFDGNNVSPFAEVRRELMSVSPGGLLQPNFVAFGSTGLSLGLERGIGVRPHLGFGIGWNWLPRGGGGSGNWGSLGGFAGGGGAGLIALPIALGIIGMIFAGKIEVRYTASPLNAPGRDFLSVVVGLGS